MKRSVVGLFLSVWLSGCALTGGSGSAPREYLLKAEFPDAASSAAESAPVISLSQPQAASGFQTRAMVYLKQPSELRAYAYNRWVAPPAEMLKPLLVAALESSGAFNAVVTANSGIPGDLRLDLTLIKLHQEFFDPQSRIRLVLRATLIDNTEGQILASRTIEITEPAPGNDPQSGVAAANRAVQLALSEIADMAASFTTKP